MISFFVSGCPAPQGSKRIVQPRGAKHPRLIEVSPHHHAWRAAVTAQTQIVCAERRLRPIRRPVSLTLTFYCPRPQRLRRGFPRGDVDKLARGCLDGLVAGGLLADDDVVTRIEATKQYAHAMGASGCHVVVRGADEPAATQTVTMKSLSS